MKQDMSTANQADSSIAGKAVSARSKAAQLHNLQAKQDKAKTLSAKTSAEQATTTKEATEQFHELSQHLQSLRVRIAGQHGEAQQQRQHVVAKLLHAPKQSECEDTAKKQQTAKMVIAAAERLTKCMDSLNTIATRQLSDLNFKLSAARFALTKVQRQLQTTTEKQQTTLSAGKDGAIQKLEEELKQEQRKVRLYEEQLHMLNESIQCPNRKQLTGDLSNDNLTLPLMHTEKTTLEPSKDNPHCTMKAATGSDELTAQPLEQKDIEINAHSLQLDKLRQALVDSENVRNLQERGIASLKQELKTKQETLQRLEIDFDKQQTFASEMQEANQALLAKMLHIQEELSENRRSSNSDEDDRCEGTVAQCLIGNDHKADSEGGNSDREHGNFGKTSFHSNGAGVDVLVHKKHPKISQDTMHEHIRALVLHCISNLPYGLVKKVDDLLCALCAILHLSVEEIKKLEANRKAATIEYSKHRALK